MDIPDKLDFEIVGEIEFGDTVTKVKIRIFGIAQNLEVDYEAVLIAPKMDINELSQHISENVLLPMLRKPTDEGVITE